MKTISFWAKNHVPQAQVILVLLKISLGLLAIYAGLLLTNTGYFTQLRSLYIFAAVAAISAFTYPNKYRPTANFYRKQKTRDFLISLCAFCLLAGVTNRLDMPLQQSGNLANASSIMHHGNAAQIISSLEHRNKKTLSRKEKRILKKEFFTQVKIYAKASLLNDKVAKGESWKTILVIIGALGLLYLVTALSCSLSCNGAEGAALVVGILGLAGIIWGSIALINRIYRGPPVKTPAPQQ